MMVASRLFASRFLASGHLLSIACCTAGALAPLCAGAQIAAIANGPSGPAANAAPASSAAQVLKGREYLLGAGDLLKISVYQMPDLTLETRVSENGTLTYPLIGTVEVGGLAVSLAEQRIAAALKAGNYVIEPQVSILVEQVRGNQVAALGYVNRPGRFPLETNNMHLSDLLAQAGGISAPGGSDTILFIGVRDGHTVRKEIDVARMFAGRDADNDLLLAPGDLIYVDRAPMFYIYGEVQHPGAFRVERGMTIIQALATGGGLTPKGTKRGLQVRRHDADGRLQLIEPDLEDRVRPDDVIVIREGYF